MHGAFLFQFMLSFSVLANHRRPYRNLTGYYCPMESTDFCIIKVATIEHLNIFGSSSIIVAIIFVCS